MERAEKRAVQRDTKCINRLNKLTRTMEMRLISVNKFVSFMFWLVFFARFACSLSSSFAIQLAMHSLTIVMSRVLHSVYNGFMSEGLFSVCLLPHAARLSLSHPSIVCVIKHSPCNFLFVQLIDLLVDIPMPCTRSC